MQGSPPPLDPVALLSRDRLSGFQIDGGPNGDRHLLGRYLYNLGTSYALYPYLHTLEVVLRNRIYDVVAQDHPVDRDRPDLYRRFPCWLDAEAKYSLLLPDHQGAVADASQDVFKDLRRRWGATAAQRRSMYTPGRLVARLTLSFWVYLFDAEYVGKGRGDPGVLWPRYFDRVFPTPKHGLTITRVRTLLRRLLIVRNRTMHFERIAPWADRDGSLNPTHLRDDIQELIHAMSPQTAQALDDHGPHPMLFGKGFERCLGVLAFRL